jgi:hypothetical protein
VCVLTTGIMVWVGNDNGVALGAGVAAATASCVDSGMGIGSLVV